jgi:hypothetical protein
VVVVTTPKTGETDQAEQTEPAKVEIVIAVVIIVHPICCLGRGARSRLSVDHSRASECEQACRA